jgi:hypothetical protein
MNSQQMLFSHPDMRATLVVCLQRHPAIHYEETYKPDLTLPWNPEYRGGRPESFHDPCKGHHITAPEERGHLRGKRTEGEASLPPRQRKTLQTKQQEKETDKQIKIYYEFLRGPSTLKLLFISFHENNDNARAIVRDLTFPWNLDH